jgi:hypothetical protein
MRPEPTLDKPTGLTLVIRTGMVLKNARHSEAASAEQEIVALARSDIDSGPANKDAMPSFYLALDAVQRTRNRRSV